MRISSGAPPPGRSTRRSFIQEANICLSSMKSLKVNELNYLVLGACKPCHLDKCAWCIFRYLLMPTASFISVHLNTRQTPYFQAEPGVTGPSGDTLDSTTATVSSLAPRVASRPPGAPTNTTGSGRCATPSTRPSANTGPTVRARRGFVMTR